MADERQGIVRPGAPEVPVAEAAQGVVRHDDAEYERYRQAQITEYGKWVASQDIYAGNALAYKEGDPVPISNVELHGYDKNGMVRLTNPEPEAPVKPAPQATKGGEK